MLHLLMKKNSYRGLTMNELEISKPLDMETVIEYEIGDVDSFDTEQSVKFPLEQINNLGVAFKPMVQGIQNVFGNGGANGGLMWVDAKGGQLFKNANGNFIGNIKAANGGVGGGIAELHPLAMDPTMLFVAMALSNITAKLDEINETQKEMFDYMKNRDESQMKGSLKYLSEIMNDYKFNWNNEGYKTTRQQKVVDINKEAHDQLDFYRNQVLGELKKNDLIHWQKDSSKRVHKLISYLSNYQLAAYIYSLSSYEDIILTNNRNADYLSEVAKRIDNIASEYRNVYSRTYTFLEKYTKNSGEQWILKGAGVAAHGLGAGLNKVPLVNKLPVDEKLKDAGDHLIGMKRDMSNDLLKQLLKKQKVAVQPFIENIELQKHIYNDEIQIGVDGENIYLV